MQLELNKDELKAVLLEWAEKHWPGQFNAVDISSRYSSDGATFSKETPEPEDK